MRRGVIATDFDRNHVYNGIIFKVKNRMKIIIY